MSTLIDLKAPSIVFITYFFPLPERIIGIRELDDISGLKNKTKYDGRQ